jgi:hypothetical protein
MKTSYLRVVQSFWPRQPHFLAKCSVRVPVLRASVTGAVSDSGAPQRSGPRTVRPQQIGLEYDWPACCSAMYLEVCWKGYEWKFASHHRTEKSDGLASMRDSCADGST